MTLDAAATRESALAVAWLGPDHEDPGMRDALHFDHWAGLAAGEGATVWLNPPYLPTRLLDRFLARAVATAHAGTRVVGLLPASTGAAWWWRHVFRAEARVEFLEGRLAFEGPHASHQGAQAPWASALTVWEPLASPTEHHLPEGFVGAPADHPN